MKIHKLRKNSRICQFSVLVLNFFLRFNLFIHERHTDREAETQAEGEAGSVQGTQCGTLSRDSRIMPWAEGRRSTSCSTAAEPPRDPSLRVFMGFSAGCFNLINPPCTCHPNRFLSFIYHVRKDRGLFPEWV